MTLMRRQLLLVMKARSKKIRERNIYTELESEFN